MKNLLKKYFRLSDNGAKNMERSILYSTLRNMIMIFQIWAVMMFLKDGLEILNGGNIKLYKYFIIIPIIIFLRYIFERLSYDSVYTSTYTETAQKRIDLSKRLAKLPLAFYQRRDLADLSKTILTDMEAMEHAFSHAVPQFFGAIFSTIIIFIMILFYNYKMALAIFWPLPIVILLIFLFKS